MQRIRALPKLSCHFEQFQLKQRFFLLCRSECFRRRQFRFDQNQLPKSLQTNSQPHSGDANDRQQKPQTKYQNLILLRLAKLHGHLQIELHHLCAHTTVVLSSRRAEASFAAVKNYSFQAIGSTEKLGRGCLLAMHSSIVFDASSAS